MAEGPPPETSDLAVRAFIALFVLGSVLHGFDVMRPDGIKSSVGWWIIATILAVFDWFWVRIKSLLGPRFALTANNVATDFRWWTSALMLLFASLAASDIYQALPTAAFYYIGLGVAPIAFLGLATGIISRHIAKARKPSPQTANHAIAVSSIATAGDVGPCGPLQLLTLSTTRERSFILMS